MFDIADVNYENDVYFKHLDIVFKIVVKIGINNMYLILDIIKNDRILRDNINIMYNTNNFMNVIEYDGLNAIAMDFISECKHNRILSHTVAFVEDESVIPWKIMFNACHYFFIPLRINHNSIPESVQFVNLLRWINLIYLIPLSDYYLQQYNINFLVEKNYFNTISTVQNDPRAKMIFRNKNLVHKIVENIYMRTDACNKHNTIIFAKCFAICILKVSQDIIKHYCPNIENYIAINPNFTGQWMTFDDVLFNRHMYVMRRLTNKVLAQG